MNNSNSWKPIMSEVLKGLNTRGHSLRKLLGTDKPEKVGLKCF